MFLYDFFINDLNFFLKELCFRFEERVFKAIRDAQSTSIVTNKFDTLLNVNNNILDANIFAV